MRLTKATRCSRASTYCETAFTATTLSIIWKNYPETVTQSYFIHSSNLGPITEIEKEARRFSLSFFNPKHRKRPKIFLWKKGTFSCWVAIGCRFVAVAGRYIYVCMHVSMRSQHHTLSSFSWSRGCFFFTRDWLPAVDHRLCVLLRRRMMMVSHFNFCNFFICVTISYSPAVALLAHEFHRWPPKYPPWLM